MKSTAPSRAGVGVRELAPGESLHSFIDVAWQVNSRDPNWIPPLRMTLAAALDRTRHPFHAHAEVAYFLAEREGEPVGRIAAILNHAHNDYHSERTGFFGLFECADDSAAAQQLLTAAEDWLAARGMERMRGPVNFSTNEEVASPGVLIDGFESPPVVMMTHNPRYYPRLMEDAGLAKVKDLYAFWFDDPAASPQRGARTLGRILDRENAVVRTLDIKRFQAEVDIIKGVYNAAWSRNWGFVPMTDAEFDHLAKEFRPVVDPNLCLIAEVDGEPVGFSLALPDLNEAFRHIPDGRLFPFGIFRFLWYRRKIRGLRVLTLGFLPRYQAKGLGPAFYIRGWEEAVRKGYTHGECSWILEDNLDMVRPLERMGGRRYKTYRIYEKPLEAERAAS